MLTIQRDSLVCSDSGSSAQRCPSVFSHTDAPLEGGGGGDPAFRQQECKESGSEFRPQRGIECQKAVSILLTLLSGDAIPLSASPPPPGFYTK